MTAQQAPTSNPLEYLSFSRLDTYNQCGKKYQLRYMQRVEEQPQGALIGGRAIHEAIAAAETDQWWRGPAGLQQLLDTYLHHLETGVEEAGGADQVRWGGRSSKLFPQGETLEWWRQVGPQMLGRYVALRQDDDEAGYTTYPNGIEMEVLVPLPGSGLPIKGYIDAFLMASPEGETVLRDWKTGQVGRSNALQLATYSWALRQAVGTEPSRVEFVYLRTAKGDLRVQAQDVSQLVPLVPQLYNELIEGVSAELFPVKPGPFCTSCGVRSACPYGATLAG